MTKSFDLFDTLLVRDVYQPKDLFYFVGARLNKEKTIGISAQEFQRYRINAEEAARKFSKYEEVTFNEIYEQIKKLMNISEDIIECLKKIELDMEEKSLRVIEENFNKLNGNSILISDIYHDESFIKNILAFHKINYTDLFLSSTFKKLKHFGGLYDEALKKFSITEHTGDNLYSDIEIPKKKNIKASYFFKSLPTRYEKSIYINEIVPYDFRAIFSGAMKSSRLQKYFVNEHHQGIHEISSNILGPFLFLYVSWVIETALKNNLDTLFFISRDGQILFKIAEKIIESKNAKIKAKYLFGSRKAWHLSATTQIDEETLDWIFDQTEFLSIKDICKRAEINYEDIKDEIFEFTNVDSNLSLVARGQIRQIFSGNLVIQRLILTQGEIKHKRVIAYLHQQGFENRAKVGIVDVGWRGRQQVSLSKILKRGGLYPEEGITGFYLTLVKPAKVFEKDKMVTFFNYQDDSKLFAYPAIYEHFVAADHGSCIDYSLEGQLVVPVLRNKLNVEKLNWGLSVQQESILLFTENILNSLKKYQVKVSDFQLISRALLAPFFNFPSKKEAFIYDGLTAYEDQEENKIFPICRKLGKAELIKLFCFRNTNLGRHLWYEGSIANSFNNGSDFALKSFALIKESKIKLIKWLKRK